MSKQPALLACLACREKHLKCDGQKPRCQRCHASGAECRWTPSRRGYRGIRKRPLPTESISAHALSIFGNQSGAALALSRRKDMQLPAWFDELDCDDDGNPTEALNLGMGFHDMDAGPLQPVTGIGDKILPAVDEEQQLIDLYYANFHGAHPILPPARALPRLPPFAPCLDAVVKFIGSHYDDNINTSTRAITARAAFRVAEPNGYHKVQALLLYAVVLHARNVRNESQDWLDMAVNAALELGLNNRHFSEAHGANDPILKESLRRTWWELFIADGMIAALHQKTDFQTSSTLTDVGLPCNEQLYLQDGFIPQPRTMAQLQNRVFVDDDTEFSSYCYRIEAVQLLGRVMALGGDLNGKEDQVDGVDMAISGWSYHLPEDKKEVLAHDGSVDEMLFQAFMIVNCAAIYLHLPRSHLMAAHAPNAGMACAERLTISLPASTPHTHAVKTIEAANKLSSLASLQVPAEKHTPFFICSLVLDSIVQLSACSIKACACLEVHRDGITLAIGVLKALGQVWPISKPALQQVKAVARMVLEIGVHPMDRQISFDSIIEDKVLLGDTPDLESQQQIELPIQSAI